MPPEETATTPAETTSANTETQGTTESEITQSSILAEATGNTETASTETKTEETKTEDTKPEANPAKRGPEEYAEFKLPEGAAIDEEGMTGFKGLAKELDLTQEQAQKLLEFGGEKIKAMAEAPSKLWAETQAKWQAEVKADPEIGGTKFQDSVKTAALVFEPGESNPFVSSAEEAVGLRNALNATGAGNNPAIVKLFVKMGSILKEPAGLAGKPVAATRASLLDKMYPTMKSEE
jgi:hypothetical protein